MNKRDQQWVSELYLGILEAIEQHHTKEANDVTGPRGYYTIPERIDNFQQIVLWELRQISRELRQLRISSQRLARKVDTVVQEGSDILAEEDAILTDVSGFDAEFQTIKDDISAAQPQLSASAVRDIHSKLDAIKTAIQSAKATGASTVTAALAAEEASETPAFETTEDAPPAPAPDPAQTPVVTTNPVTGDVTTVTANLGGTHTTVVKDKTGFVLSTVTA